MATPSPRVSFDPHLSLQRQTFLLEALRKVKPRSVLDIGCGEGRLFECLVHCDDALPVELVAGIDLSIQVLQQASMSIETTARVEQVNGRWRALDITLLHGLIQNNGKLTVRQIYRFG